MFPILCFGCFLKNIVSNHGAGKIKRMLEYQVKCLLLL